MRKFNLRCVWQGVRGGKNHYEDAGYSAVYLRENGNSMIDFSVDTFEGSGVDYKERDNALIQISIHDGKTETWQGTVNDLIHLITKE